MISTTNCVTELVSYFNDKNVKVKWLSVQIYALPGKMCCDFQGTLGNDENILSSQLHATISKPVKCHQLSNARPNSEGP